MIACSSEPEVADTPPKAPRETAAVLGPAQLRFGETGVGEIGVDTPMELDRIQSLFPQSVVRAVRASPDAGQQRITVRRDDGLALDLQPGADPRRVGRIVGSGGPIVGAGGEALGAAWAELAFEAESCLRGAALAAGQMVCHRPGQPQLGYVFEVPAAAEEQSDSDAPATAQAARLSAFVWTASAA